MDELIAVAELIVEEGSRRERKQRQRQRCDTGAVAHQQHEATAELDRHGHNVREHRER